MWKCPKCGREFKNTNQDHYCIKPQTIDDYIAAQEESIRPRLQKLRAIIHDAIPDADETIAWSMPTFRKGKNLISFACFRKHTGLYPGDEAVAAFAEKLAGFEVRKGTIRLPHEKDLPQELITEISRWCYAAYAKKKEQ